MQKTKLWYLPMHYINESNLGIMREQMWAVYATTSKDLSIFSSHHAVPQLNHHAPVCGYADYHEYIKDGHTIVFNSQNQQVVTEKEADVKQYDY